MNYFMVGEILQTLCSGIGLPVYCVGCEKDLINECQKTFAFSMDHSYYHFRSVIRSCHLSVTA